MNPDYIALIRTNLSPDDLAGISDALTSAADHHESALVFLHGDGVEAAAAVAEVAANRSADWRVCRTSWVRRSGCPPEPPIAVDSLTRLFQRLPGARRVDSFGHGGSLCCRRGGSRDDRPARFRFVLDIGFAPADELQRRETLEIVLGAAAMELDACVLFHGGGLAHLIGEAARAWNQITDFGLLEMVAEIGTGDPKPDVAVPSVDAIGAWQLRSSAATILIL